MTAAPPRAKVDVYCFDTGPFIDLARLGRSLDRTVLAGPWEAVEKLIADGRVITPHEVVRELDVWDDGMATWARRQPGLIRPHDAALINEVQLILRQFPDLAQPKKPGGPAADAYVVALAKLEDERGQADLFDRFNCAVVTSEKAKAGRQDIPNACGHFSLTSCDIGELFRREGLKF